MSFEHGTFDSDQLRPLSSLGTGVKAMVRDLRSGRSDRAARLLALGVSPGAIVTVLQTFPGFVFLCDQTELAVERDIARMILVVPVGDSP